MMMNYTIRICLWFEFWVIWYDLCAYDGEADSIVSTLVVPYSHLNQHYHVDGMISSFNSNNACTWNNFPCRKVSCGFKKFTSSENSPLVVGEFRMDLQALFSVYNGGGQTVENNKILMHLFNARKASLTSRVPSFYSNIRAKWASKVTQTDVTQAYLEW
jgi:hypothetical protein